MQERAQEHRKRHHLLDLVSSAEQQNLRDHDQVQRKWLQRDGPKWFSVGGQPYGIVVAYEELTALKLHHVRARLWGTRYWREVPPPKGWFTW